MINFYRRHQCLIFAILGSMTGAAMARIDAFYGWEWWLLLSPLVLIYIVPASWQDRRNRHLPKQIARQSVTDSLVRGSVTQIHGIHLSDIAQQNHGHPGVAFSSGCRYCRAI